MRTIYIADDGAQFEDKWECEVYEFCQTLPDLDKIILVDDNGKILNSDSMLLFDEDTYTNTQVIIISSAEAVKSLHKIAEYTGFCEYKDITQPGFWRWGLEV